MGERSPPGRAATIDPSPTRESPPPLAPTLAPALGPTLAPALAPALVTQPTTRSPTQSSFVVGVLPAPALAILVPGPLSFRAIIAAATAAAQCAYSLASAEYNLAAAVESVAVKTRAAAIADTYANQGARAGSILPFTSALSGLSAAVTVAVVEASYALARAHTPQPRLQTRARPRLTRTPARTLTRMLPRAAPRHCR